MEVFKHIGMLLALDMFSIWYTWDCVSASVVILAASKVDPLHLKYFKFAGRVIALALMHKVQVGIVFDRAFFLQLAGSGISLEDIKDADPYLYSSCKQILDMDPSVVDQDVLGLTFAREIEELGCIKVVELFADGKNIVVNSRNREEYVELLIQHSFVTSVSEQVTQFVEGFEDIVRGPKTRKLFFKSLALEDLDGMLHGSESSMSVEDWKAHTEYNGYKETDDQIDWFWKQESLPPSTIPEHGYAIAPGEVHFGGISYIPESRTSIEINTEYSLNKIKFITCGRVAIGSKYLEIVGEMTAKQQQVLLSFWTSLKHLPVEGFSGLASKLHIYKSNDSVDLLPSSHTCFYRICFPAYPSMAVMRERLNIITQEHVGCSFGT
ncbi:E3 ubiquitin protein ligase UPL5, partial [Tanacetum coccineum]